MGIRGGSLCLLAPLFFVLLFFAAGSASSRVVSTGPVFGSARGLFLTTAAAAAVELATACAFPVSRLSCFAPWFCSARAEVGAWPTLTSIFFPAADGTGSPSPISLVSIASPPQFSTLGLQEAGIGPPSAAALVSIASTTLLFRTCRSPFLF